MWLNAHSPWSMEFAEPNAPQAPTPLANHAILVKEIAVLVRTLLLSAPNVKLALLTMDNV